MLENAEFVKLEMAMQMMDMPMLMGMFMMRRALFQRLLFARPI